MNTEQSSTMLLSSTLHRRKKQSKVKSRKSWGMSDEECDTIIEDEGFDSISESLASLKDEQIERLEQIESLASLKDEQIDTNDQKDAKKELESKEIQLSNEHRRKSLLKLPKFLLRAIIISGKDLIDMDHGGMSDPYVVVEQVELFKL